MEVQPPVPPPPVIQPLPHYTPPPQKKTPLWIILLIAGGVVGAIILSVGAVAGYYVWQYGNASVKPQRGFGEVRKIADAEAGWATYRFPDMEFDVELPGEPVPTTMEFENGSGVIYTNYSYYECESQNSIFTLHALWLRSRHFIDLQDDLNQYIEELKSGERYKTLKGGVFRATYGDLRGVEFRGAYTLEGESYNVKLFVFAEGKMSCLFHAEGYAGTVEPEFERIVNSIRLRP